MTEQVNLQAIITQQKQILEGTTPDYKPFFVVDELLGEHQTVIKPLGKVFQNLKGISGTTILGSGEVAMILDVPEMVNRVINSGKKQFMSSEVVH